MNLLQNPVHAERKKTNKGGATKWSLKIVPVNVLKSLKKTFLSIYSEDFFKTHRSLTSGLQLSPLPVRQYTKRREKARTSKLAKKRRDKVGHPKLRSLKGCLRSNQVQKRKQERMSVCTYESIDDGAEGKLSTNTQLILTCTHHQIRSHHHTPRPHVQASLTAQRRTYKQA